FTNDGKQVVIGTAGVGHLVLDAFTGDLNHFCYRKSGHSGRLTPGAEIPNGASNGNTPALGQGDLCVSPDGQYLIGGHGDEGLLVWDISKERQPNNSLEPTERLPGSGKAAIVGYNPRTNFIATADRDLLLWQPDQDLMLWDTVHFLKSRNIR